MVGEGSRLIASDTLNVGIVINVMFAVTVGCFSLAQLAPRIQSFVSARAASQNIFRIIYRVPGIDSMDKGGERPTNLKGDIKFDDVTFIYPSRPGGTSTSNVTDDKVIVLQNISFHIPEGKFTAIVGPSGSGKSTIIHLLKRFYDPIEGSIKLDGNDLKDLNVQHLRSSMSLVSQEPTLFSTSVFQNICDGYFILCHC
jgi:ATP-binding cassette, subfamily B (MDR/TAP), member 1